MQRTHHSAETRAVLRAVDARNEVATTLNTSTAHSDADTITADPVRVEGGPTTRCELSQRVDQQTGSGQRQRLERRRGAARMWARRWRCPVPSRGGWSVKAATIAVAASPAAMRMRMTQASSLQTNIALTPCAVGSD